MNRWARHHRHALVDELYDEEELLAAGRVMINAAVPPPALPEPRRPRAGPPVERRPTGGLGGFFGSRSDRLQRRAARGRGGARTKTRAAQQIGFPAPGPVMVLGVTNQRLVIWRPTALLARPGGIIADIPLDRVGGMHFARRFGMGRLGVSLPSGATLVLQNLWCNALPALAAAWSEVRR